MNPIHSIQSLRQMNWQTVPTEPGVYWWFFPESCLVDFGIAQHCALDQLHFRQSTDGLFCLYHGCASNLRQRVKWHAAQKLRQSALRSGYLSTFRFTLLSLTGFAYSTGESALNGFMDTLQIHWQPFATKGQAKEAESVELASRYHYPLNIQENRRVELAGFTPHLKRMRKAYKTAHLV